MATITDFTNFSTEHPNYFSGQYLLEDDFELEHKYLSDRQHYYNHILHIYGIIEGLEVELIPDKKAVLIKSGSAINNNGELIVLKVDLDFSDFKDTTKGELYIQYFEDKQVKQQENVADSYTRWIENPLLGFAQITPDRGVKLATLTISDGTITIDANIREYSGLSLPNSNGQALTLRSGGNTNPNLAVLTGSLEIDGGLKVAGDIRADNSDLYFTKTDHNHSGIGNTTGFAAIENAADADALMILGRAGTSKGRSVKLWDYLQVNGGMDITGNLGIGTNDPGNYKLNVQGNQYLRGNLIVEAGKVNLNGNQQIIFTDTDTTNNLKLQLWSGFGLGINSSTLFYTANGNHSWRDSQNKQRMLLTTGANGGLTVTGTGTSSFAGNLTVAGAITPSLGNSQTNGIIFPKDPFGGSGDAAWIRYYRRGSSGEATTFEIGTSNDVDDHIALMPGSGGVGIGTNNPGSYKLNVQGNQYLSGDLTIQAGTVNLAGDRQIVFTNTDTTNNLKLQLWQGYGFGINNHTLFYTADGKHAWRDSQNNDRMLLTTGANGGLTVKGTGTSSFAGNLTVTGSWQAKSNISGERAILMEVPAGGNHRGDGEQNATGLVYRIEDNPNDGDPIFQVRSQGNAVRLFVEHNGWTGSQDNSAWFGGSTYNYFNGNVGIGINNPGSYKLNVKGNQYISGNLTVDGTGTSAFAGNLAVSKKIEVVERISLGTGNNVTKDSQAGIHWHSNETYGIYRTPGPWTKNSYQQLKIHWATGIILQPGTGNNAGHDKSYVDIVNGKGLKVTHGIIQPSAGNSATNGIMFPKDPGGGSADAAWIRYYRRGNSGEACTLELGISNDDNDYITLNPRSNPINFTGRWNGSTNNKTAEISNDTQSYKTLMIVGNDSNGQGRRVSVWDRFEVNGTFVNNSSQEHKQDIIKMSGEDLNSMLEQLKQTPVFRYRFKTPGIDSKIRLGVIAEQSPEEILDESGKAVSFLDYNGFLFAALKAQQSLIEQLQNDLLILQQRVNHSL